MTVIVKRASLFFAKELKKWNESGVVSSRIQVVHTSRNDVRLGTVGSMEQHQVSMLWNFFFFVTDSGVFAPVRYAFLTNNKLGLQENNLAYFVHMKVRMKKV